MLSCIYRQAYTDIRVKYAHEFKQTLPVSSAFKYKILLPGWNQICMVGQHFLMRLLITDYCLNWCLLTRKKSLRNFKRIEYTDER